MREVRLSIIAAMSMPGRIIGRSNGDLPWPKISADFERFKQLTTDHPIIMGRKTWEDISRRTEGVGLPERDHIVVSKKGLNPDSVHSPCSVFCAYSIENALYLSRKIISEKNDEVFIIGGGKIYRQTIEIVDHIYITMIEKEFEGEVTFPEFEHLFEEPIVIDRLQQDGISFQFLKFTRKGLKS